jgi:hypothetical protein
LKDCLSEFFTLGISGCGLFIGNYSIKNYILRFFSSSKKMMSSLQSLLELEFTVFMVSASGGKLSRIDVLSPCGSEEVVDEFFLYAWWFNRTAEL